MAVTYTAEQFMNLGNVMGSCGTITLDGQSSGAVQIPGISKIYGGAITPKAMGANTFSVAWNSGSGATAMNGYVQILSATASDTLHAFVVGLP